MVKASKSITVITILSLIMMLGVSSSALAASKMTFETASGATITISNIIEKQQIEDVGYGETMCVATAPVTVTFEGELLTDETWFAKWEETSKRSMIPSLFIFSRSNSLILFEAAYQRIAV